MVRFTPPVTLRLQAGEVLAWQQAPARMRVVGGGRVWVTQQDDLGDHFLHHGECFELQRERRVVIEAEHEVLLRFERDPTWHGRLGGLLRRGLRRLTRRASPAATVAG
ncbi:DUF2917 domain-containing protein [Piscinibacter sp. HJYY11]|uniref:DUF2917 domain-containing protein n=1 Tax=Piscinibacter sp. HJYY11 TaxID=2801333 RepID=UPI0019203923|nr:DUF2917 domain-containing protein [Piscinibacter sp. HJYY11]MBL0729281.1 DUF2917 domain-containing protein [Piscinibacter sp. HJYY11]